jgi:hypothetical protein
MATARLNTFTKQFIKLETMIEALEAKLRVLKAEREALEKKTIMLMDKETLDSASTEGKKLIIIPHEYPRIGNYPKFIKFVKAKGAYDLFQNRISVTSWREFRDQGIVVPGIDVFKKRTLSIRKAAKRKAK